MPSTAELASNLAAWRARGEKEHPQGLYELACEWLNDSDEDLRHEAVLFIARHLRQLSDAQTLLEMAAADPKDRLRKAACDALGGVFRNTHDRRVLAVLAGISKDVDEEGAVRAAALGAIRRINGQKF